MSNANTAQTDAPILSDAAVIDLWAFAVQTGTATREEAEAHLATLGLTLA